MGKSSKPDVLKSVHPDACRRHPKVLVVDDEKSIRATFSAFLQEDAYRVDVAADATEAQTLLRREAWDVVVTDIIMPGLSGVDLLKAIRGEAANIQVIMMTAEPSAQNAAEAVRAGACDYLIKPVNKQALLRAVATAVKIKRIEDERRRLKAENTVYQENLERLVRERTQALRDTNERLRASMEDLRRTQRQVIEQERLAALGQIASGIAHDFNNVLMPIVGFSEVLLSDDEALSNREEARHMLNLILSAGNDARQIVRRLRTVYRRVDDAEYSLVDLAKIVECALSLTMPKWKAELRARGIAIEMRTTFQPVPTIHGVADELREAVMNLIFNAIDAMPSGGTIEFRVFQSDASAVWLEVADAGIGMDEATLHCCMEPFVTTKGAQGSGLGLGIVHGIVERHDGRIMVESRQGHGTTVRMEFPVSEQIALPDLSGTELPDVRETPQLSPMQVLVIDDEDRSRHLLERFLRSDGHVVDIQADPLEGLAALRRKPFDMVITDRAMPGMSGDEVAREAQRIRPGVPLILLTGFADIMKEQNEFPSGVSQLMSKPAGAAELRRVMAAALHVAQDTMIED